MKPEFEVGNLDAAQLRRLVMHYQTLENLRLSANNGLLTKVNELFAQPNPSGADVAAALDVWASGNNEMTERSTALMARIMSGAEDDAKPN